MSDNPIIYVVDEEGKFPKMTVSDTGTAKLSFRVKGVSERENEFGVKSLEYTLEYEIDEIERNELSLKESLERGMQSQERIPVQTQYSPSPG